MKPLYIVLAAIGGATVGAAAATLFAPQKGSRTREDIVKFIKEHCPVMKDKKLQELADKISADIKEAKL